MIFSWRKNGISIGIIFTCIFSLAVGFFINSRSVHAQAADNTYSYDSSINEGDFDFDISPENPGPHETVTIKVSSNLVDANRYLITWTVDGAIVLSGVGERSITVSTKDYGQTTSVSMTIKMVDSSVTKEVVLAPQDAAILWEAVDAYAPPFYQGKKLPSPESIVRIASIPNFLGSKQSSATKNAVYIWSRNKSVIPDAGGYGKDSILIQHNRVRPNELIEVTSSSTDGTATALSSITVPFFDPFILFYERNISSGLVNPIAQGTLSLQDSATTIEAEPYFFSVSNNNPNSLKIDWTMNGKPLAINDTTDKTSLTLQNPGGTGNATIGISAENTSKLFQSAERTLNIIFRK